MNGLIYDVEIGEYEQEWVDEYGEVLLAMPATKQIQVYTLVDGHLISVVGTYYDDAHSEVVVDAITLAARSCEIV